MPIKTSQAAGTDKYQVLEAGPGNVPADSERKRQLEMALEDPVPVIDHDRVKVTDGLCRQVVALAQAVRHRVDLVRHR